MTTANGTLDRTEGEVPKLSEIARVTRRGENILDDLPGNASLAWMRAHELAVEQGGRPMELDGIPGLVWDGNLSNVFYLIWPELAERDDEGAAVRKRQLGSYLKQSKNMACLVRGGGHSKRTSQWWVRDEWSSDRPPTRPVPSNWWEAKLTASEAGEDREPAEVTRSWKCNHPGCDFEGRNAYALAGHRTKHRAKPRGPRLPEPETPAAGTDAVSAVRAVIRENERLQKEINRLQQENERLRDLEASVAALTTSLRSKR